MSNSNDPRLPLLRELFQAGIDAVGGEQATARALQRFDLHNNVHLVALGKAADSMATGALSVLGDRLVSGLIVSKHDHIGDSLKADARLHCIEAGHPVPDAGSLEAGKQLSAFVSAIPADQQLLFLVSGGTSALVEYLEEGLTLEDLKRQTDQLLASGAPIGEMNIHRRKLSRIKGGKLSALIQCRVLQLLISDVPGDKIGDIGSGLLVPDIETGMTPDMPVWQRIETHIIASSTIAQQAVEQAALSKGLRVRQPKGNLDGDMQQVIERVSSELCNSDAGEGIYIWGGEPTVVLPEKPGRGGRNQHLALALSRPLAQTSATAVLVCGTDGTDGPTIDAGGVVTEKTLKHCQDADLRVEDYLERADAGSCLQQVDCLVTTGPTGTNVMDLAIAIVGPLNL